MSDLDARLPPDQRAVLQLLLKQGKTYEQLASLLRIDPDAVRQRALAALQALVPPPADVPAERRAEVADLLLGQQDGDEEAATRGFLAQWPTALAWAHAVADRLVPVAGSDALPDLPAEPEREAGTGTDSEPGGAAARSVPPRALEPSAAAAAEPRPGAGRLPAQRSSRLGGALLIAGVAIVLAVGLMLALRSGDGDGAGVSQAASTPAATTTTPTPAQAEPTIEGQVNLTAPGGGSDRRLGVANILTQDGQRALAVEAQGLPRTTSRSAYAVWLTNPRTDKVRRLGFAPPVGREGRLQGVAPLPDDAAAYTRLEITRETTNDPKRPGDVVLAGRFSVKGG